MKDAVGKMLVLCVVTAAMLSLTGCTNWKKKYGALDVENQNLKGLYENCVASLDSTAAERAQMSQELESLRKQLQQGKSASDATGFKGDVKVDEKAPGKVQKPGTTKIQGAERWVRTSPTGRLFRSPDLVARDSAEVASLLRNTHWVCRV